MGAELLWLRKEWEMTGGASNMNCFNWEPGEQEGGEVVVGDLG